MTLNTFFIRAKNILCHGSYIPPEYFVVDEKKFIYIPVPKVACTSIKVSLFGGQIHASNGNNSMDIHHETAKLVKYSLDPFQKKYYKVAFVRNPFKRIVSCYEDKVKTKIQHNGRYHFSSKYNNVLIKKIFGNHFNHKMSFMQFVQLVSKIPDWLSDAHFKSQHSILFAKKNCDPDFIGKIENLTRDWPVIANKYNFAKLPHSNKTSTNNWIHYYSNKKAIELVAKRYQKDIVKFGYNADYLKLLQTENN